MSKLYRIILADPPWRYGCSSPTAAKRPPSCQRASGVAYYYDTLSAVEVAALPIQQVAHKDSVLFLWVTVPLLPDGFKVLTAWGYKYKTMLTWHKLRCKGMGYWFRGHTEHLLLGIKGKVKAFRSLHHNIQEHVVGKHSEKPALFHRMIEDAAKGLEPRVELFARRKTPGWDVWGKNVISDVEIGGAT